MKILYHVDIDEDGGGVAFLEKRLSETPPASPSTQTIGGITAAGELVLALTTVPGEPNSAQYPNPVVCKLDVLSIDATSTYGFLAQGAAVGGAFRMNALLDTVLESQPQSEGAFSTPGLKTCTFPAPWAAGDATNRAQLRLAAVKTGGGADEIGIIFDGDGLITADFVVPLSGIKTISARIVSGTLDEGSERSLRFREGDAGNEVRLLLVQVGDDGVEEPVDVSGATTLDFIWVRPNGVPVRRTGAFVTDGTDALITYTTVAGDFFESGRWRLFANIVLPSPAVDLYSEEITVRIDPSFKRGTV